MMGRAVVSSVHRRVGKRAQPGRGDEGTRFGLAKVPRDLGGFEAT
jgi:hypothetical protein